MEKYLEEALAKIKANDEHPERGEIRYNSDVNFFERGYRKNGLYESWYSNGQLCERKNYLVGKLHGLQESWHKNGKLFIRENYKHGLRDGIYEQWHKNGQQYLRENYKDDMSNGLCEGWHTNGQLNWRANVKNDKMEGLYEEWHSNGQLKERAHFKNDKLNGLREVRADDSTITRSMYEHGVEVSRSKVSEFSAGEKSLYDRKTELEEPRKIVLRTTSGKTKNKPRL